MFITVSGPIGAGKSTVTGILSGIMDFTPFFETVENHPYLEGLYRDPDNYAFRTQVFFLRDRFEKHMESVNSGRNIVADRSIYEDVIFAEVLYRRGNMQREEFFETYLPHFNLLISLLPPPDLMIYLHADIDTLLYRISTRGRSMEKSISRDYMELLSRHYDAWIAGYPHKKLLVDTGGLDLTCDVNPDWSYLIQAIFDAMGGNGEASASPLLLRNLKSIRPAEPVKTRGTLLSPGL